MKITGLQLSVLLGEVENNYSCAEKNIRMAAEKGADVVVLPELWNTSFYPEDVAELADEDGKRTQAFLSRLAGQYGINIVGGSAAVRCGQQVYNRTYVVDRSGQVVSSYDKVHLFTPGREDDKFTPGKTMNIFALDGVTMASIICYDVRFAEWVRMAALAGAQVLFVPAAWPVERVDHWRILNRARAIENQMFVVAVNNCGAAGAMQFGGSSLIADPWGKVLAQGGRGAQAIEADIDLSVVAGIRRSINVFRDRRPDLYHFDGGDEA